MNREKQIKRRAEIQIRLKEKERMSLISDLVSHLERQKIEYKVHFDSEWVDKVLASYPGDFSGINWAEIPNSTVVSYQTSKERNLVISNALNNCLKPSEVAFVTWSNALRPTLELFVRDIINNACAIVDEDFDVWILHLENRFCLEHYHEGYVAWTNMA